MFNIVLLFTSILVLLFLILNQKTERFTSNKKMCIFQTYSNKSAIPQKVYDNIKRYAPNYKHIITDDNENKNFIMKYYGEKYLNAYNKLEYGAHKADLWRYLVLYKYGGIYMDIKTELLKPVDDIFTDKSTMYLVQGSNGTNIYNGLMYSPPKNPVYLKLINLCLENIEEVKKDYMLFVKQFHTFIKEKITSENIPICENIKISGLPTIYIFNEKCTKNKDECPDGLDRYGFCCYIYGKNNEKVFKTRYSDFPW